jgi:predicted exporter
MTLNLVHRVRLLVALLLLSGCAGARVRESTPSTTDIRALPKIDVHAHYRTNHPDLVPVLSAWNARAVLVNVTGSERRIDEKWRDFVALRDAHPDRFVLVATFDPFRFDEPDFAARTIDQLRAQIAAGAKGVKVWKDIGMELEDAQGRHV